MSKKAIIVDIDGTLADVEHRVHHVRKEKKDWKSFNDGMIHDELNIWCAGLIEAMKKDGCEIILLTGRSDDYREQTVDWLKKHSVDFDQLLMRSYGDHRGDEIVKKEIYEQNIKKKYEVLFVVDDRLSVVKMWRENGLVCLQCDWGDF